MPHVIKQSDSTTDTAEIPAELTLTCYNRVMIKNLTESQKVYLQTGLILLAFVLVGLGWLWWVKVYTSPKVIFNNMLSNSLNTYGVTKTTDQKDDTGELKQISQTQFGARNLVDVKTTITQGTDGGDAVVTTQSVGNGTDNFVRYVDVNVPKQEGKPDIDFTSLKAVWGKQDPQGGIANNSFTETLYGAVLFGYLPSQQRNELLSFMKDKDIYKVDYSKIEYKNEDGKNVIVYPVEVNTKSYVELLQKYDQILGLELMSQLSADDYANSPPITLSLSVDKVSRYLTRVTYPDGARTENLSGYGIHKDVQLPTESISSTELEGRLQNLLYGQE